MISQEQLCEEIKKKGGRCYPPKEERIGFSDEEGRLIYGVGWIKLNDGSGHACDVNSRGGLKCYHDGMDYDISPGVVMPEAEAPLATEKDIARTKSFFANFNPGRIKR